MPIWLRKFTVSQLMEQNKKETEQIKKASKSNQNSTSTDIGEPLPEHMKQVFKQASKQADYISKKAKK